MAEILAGTGKLECDSNHPAVRKAPVVTEVTEARTGAA
jgi:hypothetical protein